MGYKGTMRSVKGSINRSIRASESRANKKKRAAEREQREQQELLEKLQRKMAAAEEKRNSPTRKLSELYADGKIPKEKYDELLKRDSEITIDLIIFGRNAGLKIAERYITGAISKGEFESLKNDVLGEAEAEKDYFLEEFEKREKEVSEFVEKARSNNSSTNCNYCGRVKKFYSPLVKELDFKLCVPCKTRISKMRKHPAQSGNFYSTELTKIESDSEPNITLNIRHEHILKYR